MPLNARCLVRKMRGGAQAHLLEADDGNFYVVKFQNNPQHRRILINEWIASTFLKYLQITTPEFAIISVSREFLEANPEVHFQLGSKRQPVAPGWHFGSRFPGDPAMLPVYDYLPDALLEKVENLSHFLAVLVLDKWMSNADGRQCIYFRARLSRAGIVASMIDQGFVFNGPYWEFVDSPIQGLAPRHVAYRSVRSLDDFQPWLDQVTHFPEEVVDLALRQIPPEWFDGDESELERLLEKLLRRRGRVADLVSECRKGRADAFPNWR